MTSFRVRLVMLFLISVTQVDSVQDAIRHVLYGNLKNYLPKVRDSNRGVVKNCGPPGANFTIEWDPKVINPLGSVVVYYNLTIPYDFESGSVNATLYIYTNPNPVFQGIFPIECGELHKYIPMIPCPMKAGLKIQGKYKIATLQTLEGNDGTYTAEVVLKNEKGKVMFCAIADVTIKE